MASEDSDLSMLVDDESVFSDEEDDFESDLEENVAPLGNSKGSMPTFSKKTKGSALSTISTNKKDDNIPAVKSNQKEKTVEQMYQKKTQLEHILIRPDTYIGSVEPVTQPMFVLDTVTDRIVNREITYTPGLYKIFDEIVVNAADNKQRDHNMDKLDIFINQEENVISVKNNGKGIPIVMHKEHKCYIPTMIFGHLLTGSNFDDTEKKTTGGRNGYGAKLANIFSDMFIVECVDTENGKKFKQTFRGNMSTHDEPVIKKCTKAELKAGDYTMISFSPDLARFKMANLDNDTVSLLSKRAYDIAGSMASRPGKRLAVTLNGKKLPIKNFQDYLKIFDGINAPVAYEKCDERWEVGVSFTDGSFQQISFANAISTSKGGGHVNYITDKIANHLKTTLKKKNKGGTEVKPNQIKNHLCIFVNCLIENPTFDSQTKEFLTSRPKSFGSNISLSDAFMKKVDKSEIVNNILSFAKFKEQRDLKKKGGTKKSKLTGIPKLDDANFAGTAKSNKCTLILTEGDSAKSLAMSGLSVVGRDYYGVFPLRGKPLNVRDATHAQLMKNSEIQNIINIMGLKPNTVYDEKTVKTLRYGHLMIMSDQDHDGSHIKGLVINIFHHMWPSLLEIPNFFQQFITPIVKVTKGRQSKTFFTLPEYENWKDSTGDEGKGFKIKYYKGLGTSTSAEAKEYFSNLDMHEVHFDTLSRDHVVAQAPSNESAIEFDAVLPDQTVSGSDLIDMVFRKTRVEDRKTWLNNFEKDTFMDYSKVVKEGVKYSEFINREFILFSKSDNQRSIAHVIDGFKPSQRKVLFGCIKRKLKEEIKVAQLAGYVGEHSSYHHGEASLHGAIVNMAQGFLGANNINLLTPSGQFGTRRMGGKDAASPRYIFTKLEKITRAIFHPDDDELLTYLNDDGHSIEPEYYVPVIPMVLVNGSDGIGTGWSSTVTNYNPREVIENIRRKIRGEAAFDMTPHYNGFKGDIVPEGTGKFTVKGRIERLDDTTLEITELPIRKWTQDYKDFLEGLLTGADSKNKTKTVTPDIKDFKENHTDDTVLFTISAEKELIDKWEQLPKGGLYAKFKLIGSLSTNNMNLFDTDDCIQKYANPAAIFDTFYELRMDFYCRRKALLEARLSREQRMLSNKARFVEEVCAGDLIVSNRKKSELLHDLKARSYELFDGKKKAASSDSDDENDDSEDTSDAELTAGYEYLLGMKIWSLTFEKAEKLRRDFAEKTQELEILQATSPSQIWLNDLDAVVEAMDERDVATGKALVEEHKAQKKSQQHQATKGKKKAAAKPRAKPKKKQAEEWDADMAVEQVMSAPAAKKPAAKRNTKATKKSAPEEIVIHEVDDVEMSLSDRLKMNMNVSPPRRALASRAAPKITALSDFTTPSSPASASSSSPSSNHSDSLNSSMSDESTESRGKKRSSPKAGDDSDIEIMEESPPAKKKTARSAAGTRGRKPVAKKQPAAKTSRGRKKQEIIVDSESESEGDFDFDGDSDDDDDVVDVDAPPSPPTRAATSRARRSGTKAKTTYVFSDSEDDEYEEF